jgi:integrase
LKNASRLGTAWSDFDLVFPSKVGTLLNHSRCKRVFKRAKFPESTRLYDLRHTCAALLLQFGENPKVVSERLGHAAIALCPDVYSHVLPNMQEAATEKLEKILFTK